MTVGVQVPSPAPNQTKRLSGFDLRVFLYIVYIRNYKFSADNLQSMNIISAYQDIRALDNAENQMGSSN